MAEPARQKDRSPNPMEKPIKTTLGEFIAALSEEAMPCSRNEEEVNETVAEILSSLLRGSSDASNLIRLSKADQIRVLKLFAEVEDVEEKLDRPTHLRSVSSYR